MEGLGTLNEMASVADIHTEVADAMLRTQSGPGAWYGEAEPVLEVGDWAFYGEMRLLYDGSAGLSNSTVSMGQDASTARVAVKSVRLDSDAESVKMIRRELSVLKELGGAHPHILPMLSHVETATEIVLLTPYAPQGDLHEFTNGSGHQCMPEVQVRRLTAQLLSGLSFLHAARVIHGDVKPHNIFLTDVEGGIVTQLADFGLSVWLPEGADSTRFQGVQGSYGFIPAEVIDGGEVTFAIDLFALGVMAFRLLGSHDPFYPPSKVKSALEFDDMCWEPISSRGRDFAVQLCSTDPGTRGKAGALLKEHPWLLAPEAELTGAPRAEYAPEPMPGVTFHSLDAAQAIWSRERSTRSAS